MPELISALDSVNDQSTILLQSFHRGSSWANIIFEVDELANPLSHRFDMRFLHVVGIKQLLGIEFSHDRARSLGLLHFSLKKS